MKKNLLRFFFVLSVTGNIAALLFYTDFVGVLELQGDKTTEGEQTKKDLRVRLYDLSKRTGFLQERGRKQEDTINKVLRDIGDLRKQIGEEDKAAEERKGSPQSAPINEEPSRQMVKDGVKKVLSTYGHYDKNVKIEEKYLIREDSVKFLREILPFLSQKEAVLESLLDILKDTEQKDRHKLALDCLYATTELTGTNKVVDQFIVDLLQNKEVTVEKRRELLSRVDFDKHSKDNELADKLLDAAEESGADIRASIFRKLRSFELEGVSAQVERVAFDKAESSVVRGAALGSLSNDKDYTQDLIPLLNHKESALRAGAVEKLVSQGRDPDLFQRIQRLSKSEQELNVLSQIVDYLINKGDQASISILREIEHRDGLGPDFTSNVRYYRLDLEKKAARAKAEKDQ